MEAVEGDVACRSCYGEKGGAGVRGPLDVEDCGCGEGEGLYVCAERSINICSS